MTNTCGVTTIATSHFITAQNMTSLLLVCCVTDHCSILLHKIFSNHQYRFLCYYYCITSPALLASICNCCQRNIFIVRWSYILNNPWTISESSTFVLSSFSDDSQNTTSLPSWRFDSWNLTGCSPVTGQCGARHSEQGRKQLTGQLWVGPGLREQGATGHGAGSFHWSVSIIAG